MRLTRILLSIAVVGMIFLSIQSCDKKDDTKITNPPNPQNPPVLAVSPSSLDFGADQTSKTFDITNTGPGTLTWSISDNQSWITVSPTSGSTTTGTDQITVTVNRSGVAAGSHSGTVTISSNGGTKTVSVLLTVVCDLHVTKPDFSSEWEEGESEVIQWQSSGSGYVKIEFYQGGNLRGTIINSTNNDGSYSWTVNDFNGGTSSDYQIKVTLLDGSGCYAFSDMFLFLVP